MRTTMLTLTITLLMPALAAAKPCMFNPKKATYQKCYHVSMGRCHHYGPTCAPAGKCMFNPKKATYQKCHHVSMGKCHHYGPTCSP